MRALKMAVVMSSILVAGACGRQAQPAQETTTDLAWLDSIATTPQAEAVASPEELGMAPAAEPKAEVARSEAPARVTKTAKPRATSTARHRTTKRSTASRSEGSSTGSYEGSAAGTSQGRVVTVKHTKRDAAIGAASGAVIGAVAGGSRHRVRNAAIGAVAGGVLGAVVGNNVDKSTRVEF